MTELYLVRHGQTDWNREGRYQGQSDVPLNAAGLQQAADLAEKLNGQHFEAVYSSDLKRAHRTAEILAEHLGLHVRSDPRLREIDQGEWEGVLYSEIVRRYENEMTQRKNNPIHARPPGGETVAEVSRRAVQAADDIAQLHPHGPVIVVAHGLTLAVLACLAEGVALADVYNRIPDNCSPYVIEWKVDPHRVIK
jgi:alpha-ribazole phosphatase